MSSALLSLVTYRKDPVNEAIINTVCGIGTGD